MIGAMTRAAHILARALDGELGGTDCEAIRSGWVAQPVNTASSMAYVAAGAWVVWRSRGLPGPARAWGWSYAAVLALVGLGSVDFHGPQTPGAKQLHDWPIAVLVLIAAAFAVSNWRRDGRAFPGSRRGLWVALGVTAVAAPAAFALGRTASAACRPESYLQLHSLWHILTAVGFALIAALLLPSSAVRR